MLTQLQKRREEGFTIIEVMIVLAIAGLIILVVLLAVPALQRNSRNTTIKNDAAAVAGAINEYQSINNGKMPTNVVSSTSEDTVTVSGSIGTTPVTGKVQGGTKVSIMNVAGEDGSYVPANFSEIGVVIGKKCDTAGTGVDSAASNARAVAITYKLETAGSGGATACTES